MSLTALYRRVAFNVLVSNVEDHLRNHGFLWLGRNGWTLSPAYDLNPTPTDVKARILTANIDLDEGTCSLDLVGSAAGYFGLGLPARLHEPQGRLLDNALMESFFHTLKTERVHHRAYATGAEVRRDLFGYIEGFHNPRRLHSALDYISPARAA